jgi:uncharacterized protein (DUF58 family)
VPGTWWDGWKFRIPNSEFRIQNVSFVDSFPGFRLRPTRWGLGYLAVCLVLGMAAVNTGNNALMALLGLALGSYAVSGAWSRQVLGNVTARVELPAEVFAGRPSVVDIEVLNSSRWLPAYGLVVRDSDGEIVVRESFLDAGEKGRHTVNVTFDRRGWTSLGPWRLEVALPLGFFLKSKVLIDDQRLLVYPRLLQTSKSTVRRGGGRRAPDALEARGREGEVTQLRDFREGDEMRSLHWKQTARQQTLVVVERQRPSQKPVFYVLDPRLDDVDDRAQRERFERLVSDIATGVMRRLREGVPVGLMVGSTVVPPVRSLRRAPTLLRLLAEVEPQAAGGEGPSVAEHGRRARFTVRSVSA